MEDNKKPVCICRPVILGAPEGSRRLRQSRILAARGEAASPSSRKEPTGLFFYGSEPSRVLLPSWKTKKITGLHLQTGRIWRA